MRWSSWEQFGKRALAKCTGLVAIDMSSLRVRKLPDGFMSGCTSLKSVKFPPNIRGFGINVLSGCTSLAEIDMSSLLMVFELPDGFMSGCRSLKSVKFPLLVDEFGSSMAAT